MVSLPLVKLWNIRSMIFPFALLNIKTRFRNTYLGFLWAAFEPLLFFIVLYLVFTSIRDRGEDFAIYLISGIMIYHLFVRGTSGGLGSLTSNAGIIKSLNIKREFFPVVATVAMGILAFVDVGVFFGLMPVFQFTPGWTIFLIPLPIILVLILILGVSYILSIASSYARDVSIIWQIFAHTLIFISPIFWFIKDVEGILLQLHQINPLGQIIELAHVLVIDKQIPPITDWAYTTIFVLAIFFVGYFIFHKFENTVTEQL